MCISSQSISQSLQLRLCPLGQMSNTPSAFAGPASVSGLGNRSPHSASGIPACLRPDPIHPRIPWKKQRFFWGMLWHYRDLTYDLTLCTQTVHTLCCLLEMCTGEYTFSPFPAHCKAVVKHHAHNAKVAQHTLTVTNPSAQSSHAKSPLPLACFRNSPILLLLLYSAQATVSLSK